jgi:hypothetical protein
MYGLDPDPHKVNAIRNTADIDGLLPFMFVVSSPQQGVAIHSKNNKKRKYSDAGKIS